VVSAATYKPGLNVPEVTPTLLQALTVPEVLQGSTLERSYWQRFTAADKSMRDGHPDQ